MSFFRSSGSSVLEEKMVKLGLGNHSGDGHGEGEGEGENAEIKPTSVPLYVTYNDRIRPLLDAVDKLRQLKVMNEGIELPTIVVVGDQSSGKSSVLESLAGISLPRGLGICTRVPLIMRLQQHSSAESQLHLEYNNNQVVHTDEAHVAQDIEDATIEIAGDRKGISNTPLTLVVKKRGVPDLTMVDLPGITRVPVRGQPEDIYEQISEIIMEYITPKESIILNVLSATVDFPTCESIRMSQRVDKSGERTLAVVTKADQAPEGLLEKVTADDVNIGLGYVCVRNRIGEESYEKARREEVKLFESHPLLSKIEKSIVGIPILAHKLVQIQATSLAKCLPDIVKKINGKLSDNVSELNKLPKHLSNVADAMTAFMQILGSTKESLKKILIRGEFDEFPDEKEMHGTARMADMLNDYSKELHRQSWDPEAKFLMEEIKVLEEAKGIELPNFLPRTAFLSILQRRVKIISNTPVEFVEKFWSYIGAVVVYVLVFHSNGYPQLQSCTKRAAQKLIGRMKDQSVDRVMEMVEMEKITDYTCNPEYMSKWSKLMAQQSSFKQNLINYHKMVMEGVGEVEISHLREYTTVVLEKAFDMRMRITAYWEAVLQRLVDSLALHLVFSVHKLVNKEMEKEIVVELMGPNGGGIERLLEESPSVAGKRERLNQSIKKLRESKEVVGKIMDRIDTPNGYVDLEMVVPEVDKNLLGELEALGFPKARATRALHYSGNGSLEAAVSWVVEHENDPDIDEMPMVPVNTKVEAPKPSLTPEEMKIKAQELRERARKKKEEEERRMEREKEKERIRAGKELLEAKRIEEDNERKRLLALRKAEKEEEKRAREKIRQKLEEDKACKTLKLRGQLGLPAEDPAAVKSPTPVVEKKKSLLPVRPATKAERMRDCLRSLKQNHKDDDAKVKRAFQTLLTYIGNVAKNPNEEKFRKIRLNNPSFQERVGSLKGAIELFELCGFEKIEGGEFLFLPRDKVDMAVLNTAGSELNSAIVNPFFGVL